MMSDFKYCPMCGTERTNKDKTCPKCGFKFLTGKYIKVKEETPITVKKISQEEFVEANQLMKDMDNKINRFIANYLDYLLSNQYGKEYEENISINVYEYISTYLDDEFSNNLDILEELLNNENYIGSKNTFLQWIDENRSHLPGFVLNQYMVPIQKNINDIERILDLEFKGNMETVFFKLLNDYLNSEKEFLERLIWINYYKKLNIS